MANSRLWDKQEVADYLGVKIKTIDMWVSQRQIPFIKVGSRLVRFKPEKIEEWLEKQSVKVMEF